MEKVIKTLIFISMSGEKGEEREGEKKCLITLVNRSSNKTCWIVRSQYFAKFFNLCLNSDKRCINLYQIFLDIGDKTAYFLDQIIKKAEILFSWKMSSVCEI